MHIALIDDDKEYASLLYDLVDKELNRLGDPAHTISVFHSGEEFLSKWECGLYDLIILDIFMDQLTGIEVAYKIREKGDHQVGLAFCTTSNEFASESFDVGAKYYLHKPITAESVTKMLSRFNLAQIEANRITTLPDGHIVKLRNILYANYANHKVTVFIKNEEPHQFRISYTELEKHLLPYGYFYSPSKGVILNFYEVSQLQDGAFVMSDNQNIYVVRRKMKEAKDAYTKFLFQKMSREVND